MPRCGVCMVGRDCQTATVSSGSWFWISGHWFVAYIGCVRLLIVGLWLFVGLVLLVVRLLLALLPTAVVSWSTFSQKTTEVSSVLFVWAIVIVSRVTCYLSRSLVSV